MCLNHIPATKADISPYVLMPGDPGRVDFIGEFLDDFKIIGQRREFRLGTGFYKGLPITVVSGGIGCPSTAIVTEELIDAGAKYIVRIGTCGGAWRQDIPEGSLVIPAASIRDEGTTLEYVPLGFPAVASPILLQALKEAGKSEQAFIGINRTHDAFYGSLKSVTKWGEYLLEERWQDLDTPILSSEMECAALFVIASLRGVDAGAVLAVNSSPEPLRARLFNQDQEVVTETDPGLTKKILTKSISVALNSFNLIGQ